MFPAEHFKKLNTKDNLWIYIIYFLNKKDCYAWELQSLIQEKFSFKPGRITPYRVLYSLESKNLVKSKLKERRRVYQITEQGRQEFQKAKIFLKNLLKEIYEENRN